MKKYIISTIALVAGLLLCVVLYGHLSKNYNPDDFGTQNTSDQSTSAEDKTETADFTVINVDGDEVKLSDYFGKPIVVNFWATWCGPCKSELPAFDKAFSEYGDKAIFLMVNMTDGKRDTVSGVKSFISDGGYTFPVYFDPKFSAANAYSVYSIPMTLFISADGTLADIYSGSLSEKTLTAKINRLLESNNN